MEFLKHTPKATKVIQRSKHLLKPLSLQSTFMCIITFNLHNSSVQMQLH